MSHQCMPNIFNNACMNVKQRKIIKEKVRKNKQTEAHQLNSDPVRLKKLNRKEELCEFRLGLRLHGTKLLNPMTTPLLMVLTCWVLHQVEGAITGK